MCPAGTCSYPGENILQSHYIGTRSDRNNPGFGFQAREAFSIVALGYAVGTVAAQSTYIHLHTKGSTEDNGAPGPIVASTTASASDVRCSNGYVFSMLSSPYQVTQGHYYRLYRDTTGQSSDVYLDCGNCAGRSINLFGNLVSMTGHSVAYGYGGGLDTSTNHFPRYTGAVTFFVGS